MENEVYQYLKTLDNKQLFKIIAEPQDYTPEAVVFIHQLLLARKVSIEEEENIRRELMTEVFEQHNRKEMLERKWEPVITFFNLVKKPALIKEDKYLLFFLLIIISIYYLIFLYGRLSFLYYEITNLGDIRLFFGAINFIHLFSTPVVIMLLSQKKETGWIFSTLGKTIELTKALLFQVYYLPEVLSLSSLSLLKTFLYLALLTGILICLNYHQTKNIFHIKAATQKQTIIAGIVIGVIYFFVVEKIYY